MRSEYLKSGFGEALVRTVRLPISLASDPTPAVEAAEWGRHRELRLLFAGRFALEKGGALLIRALPSIARALNRQVRLELVGKGPAAAEWQRCADQVRLNNSSVQIEFSAWKEQLALRAAFEHNHLVVIPSIWPEPFGQVGLEAGLSSRPTVAFSVGGIPEWLHEGVNGHLACAAPPTSAGLADAVVRCVADHKHYTDLCKGARAIASEYTPERHYQELMAVFSDVLSHGLARNAMHDSVNCISDPAREPFLGVSTRVQ